VAGALRAVARGHHAGVVGEDDGLDAIAHVELGEDVLDVGLHGRGAQHQVGRDLGVRSPAESQVDRIEAVARLAHDREARLPLEKASDINPSYWVFNAVFLAAGIGLNTLGARLRERRAQTIAATTRSLRRQSSFTKNAKSST
jgi:hypothetical protein